MQKLQYAWKSTCTMKFLLTIFRSLNSFFNKILSFSSIWRPTEWKNIDYLKITICHSIRIIPLRNLSHHYYFSFEIPLVSPRYYRFSTEKKSLDDVKIYFTRNISIPTNKTHCSLLNYPTRHVSEELSVKSDKKQPTKFFHGKIDSFPSIDLSLPTHPPPPWYISVEISLLIRPCSKLVARNFHVPAHRVTPRHRRPLLFLPSDVNENWQGDRRTNVR